MPRQDGRGPMGQGPMTGRRLGNCINGIRRFFGGRGQSGATPGPGLGGGRSLGQGAGRGTGRGAGRGIGGNSGRGTGRGRAS